MFRILVEHARIFGSHIPIAVYFRDKHGKSLEFPTERQADGYMRRHGLTGDFDEMPDRTTPNSQSHPHIGFCAY